MVKEITIKPYKPKTQEELELMRKSIGGSDIGRILGVSFGTPYEVYLEKIGRGKRFEANEQMEIGWELEPYVMARFAEKYNVSFLGDKSLLSLMHPHIRDSRGNLLFRGSMDNIIVEGNKLWVYEGKCTSGFIKKEELLYKYIYQPFLYCAILDAHIKENKLDYTVEGVQFSIFTNLVDREIFEWDKTARDLTDMVIEKCIHWWETHVIPEQRPGLIDEDYKQLLEFNGGECVNATEEALKAVAAIKEINKQAENIAIDFPLEGVNTAEKLIDPCKNINKNCIGEGQFLYNGVQAIAELSAPTKKGSRILKLINND